MISVYVILWLLLTFLSIPRRKKRVPARKTERLDINAHVNVLLLTLTWLIEMTETEHTFLNWLKKFKSLNTYIRGQAVSRIVCRVQLENLSINIHSK